MKTFRWAVLSFIVLSTLAAYSQTSSNVSVFATGFTNPRGLKWGPDGNLYVAEAGTGGTHTTIGQCPQVPSGTGPGPWAGGRTARISKVTPAGSRSTLVQGLPSALSPIGDTLGAADVAFIGDQLYALLAGGGCSHGNPNFPNSVLKINQDGSWTRIADLSAYVALHPVKNPNPPDFEPDGTWYNMIAVNGNLYAVEPNHGEVDEITKEGIVTRFIDVSEAVGHIVPTSIARVKNNFYMANLSTFFPINPGSAARYTVNNLGVVTKVQSGLTTAVSMVVDGDDTYFLELTTNSGFPGPGTGAVVRLRGSTFKTIAEGLTFPTGMSLGADGALYVSNFGDGPPGAGQIVKIILP